MTELNKTVIDKLLEKILASGEFNTSHIYGRYLKYLIDSSLENKSLKETTIAIEFFEKDSEFNPAEDTIVRSHTYNLRKKLEKYYFTEGKSDKYRIRIPKGHYRVDIIPYTENNPSANYYLKKALKNYQFLLIFILLVAIIFLSIKNFSLSEQLEKHKLIDPDDYIWKEYLQSELPILITPGDHFMYNMYIDEFKRELNIRDVRVNSEEDLDSLKSKYKNMTLQQTAEPYFPYHSIWSLPPIYSTLLSENQYPILRKSSSITAQMLGEYNIIFIGSIKTLYALKYTIANSNFRYEIAPHKVYYKLPQETEEKEYSTNLHSSGPNEDLILALKIPGPNGNFIFIIASYHSLGAPEIANYLTHPENRTELDDRLRKQDGSYPTYFEVLFRVVGIDKTAYSMEILVCNEIVAE